jgi:hypothetical protein
VQIVSHAGAVCRLQNPWGETAVRLTREGRPAEMLQGSLLTFPTRPGESIMIAPQD